MPGHRRRRAHERAARRGRRAFRAPTRAAPRTLRLTSPPTVEPVAPDRAGRAHAGLDRRCSGRCWPAAAAPGSRCRAATTSGPRPIDMHLAGLEALGARFTVRRRLPRGRRRRRAAGAPTSPSSSRASARPRTSSWPPSLAKGTTTLDNAAREPEIVDLCRFLNGMGAQIEGVGSPTVIVHGVPRRATCTARPPRRARPGGGGHLSSPRSASPAARSSPRRPGRAHGHVLRKLARDGPDGRSDTGRAAGRPGPTRLRSIDVATLPYPGVATDYKPLHHRHAGGGRRRGHRDREPLRRALPLRRGAGAHGRRHPHRQPPRRGPRRRPASRAPRCRRTTSAPARRWWWPGWPPRARPTSTAPTTSTGATTTWSASSGSLGADIERLDERPAVDWMAASGLVGVRPAPAVVGFVRLAGLTRRHRSRAGAFVRSAWPPRRLGRGPFGSALGHAQEHTISRTMGTSTISISSQPPWWARSTRPPAAWPAPCRWCGSRPRTAGLVGGELEGRLDAGGGLLLQVVAVDVVLLVGVGQRGGARPSGRARRRQV